MEFDDFQKRLEIIFNYFQAKKVELYVQKLWFEQVRHIPAGQPLKAILEEVMNLDSLPRNIPKAFKAAWDSWMRANTDKIAQIKADAKVKCDYCENTGFIFSSGPLNGIFYSFVSRCPECKNWNDQVCEHAMPENRKEVLERNGHVVA